jgi:hypothetical protein
MIRIYSQVRKSLARFEGREIENPGLDGLKVVALPIWARWLLVLILIGGFAALFYRLRLRVRATRNSISN